MQYRRNIMALLLWACCGSMLPVMVHAKTFQKGDVLVHLRFVHSNPDESAEITPIGGDLHVDNINVPSIDVSYFLDDEIAIQFLPGLAQHEARLTGTTLGDRDLGKIWAIAPTALLQYHHEITENIVPYVGMGISYVNYIEDDDVDIEYESGFAGILQAGLDIAIDDEKHWWANIDAKKAWAGTKSSSAGGRIRGTEKLNPLILGAGVGYKF